MIAAADAGDAGADDQDVEMLGLPWRGFGGVAVSDIVADLLRQLAACRATLHPGSGRHKQAGFAAALVTNRMDPVDLALCLAVDVSASVDYDESA